MAGEADGGAEVTTVRGWHFLPADGCIQHGKFAGEKRKKVEVGVTYSVTGKLQMCEWGLHGSERAIDALSFAPGPIACYVELSGDILRDTDKVCASERTVLAMVDATDVLREFIRDTLIVRQPHIVTLFMSAGLVDHAEAIRNLDMATGDYKSIQQVMAAAGNAWDAAWAVAWDKLDTRLEARLFMAMGIKQPRRTAVRK